MTRYKTMLAGLILALALTLAVFACPVDVTCPIHDNFHCYFTGSTQVIDGVLVGVYHCPRGHNVLARCN